LKDGPFLDLSTEWHWVQPLSFIALMTSASAAALAAIEKANIAAAARREMVFIYYS
jgi:hypothetical protein